MDTIIPSDIFMTVNANYLPFIFQDIFVSDNSTAIISTQYTLDTGTYWYNLKVNATDFGEKPKFRYT